MGKSHEVHDALAYMISIIVLCWNHYADLTKPFVESMIKLSNNVSFELVLWDNGSMDVTRQELRKLSSKYSFIKVGFSDTNLGFAAGNNSAIGLSSGENIIFMNNDVLLPKRNWLSDIEKLLESEEKLIVGQELVTVNTATIYRGKIQEYINGWCLGLTRKSLDDLKEDKELFDEGFDLAYFEDVELCVRATKKGYRLQSVPLGLVHLGSKSSVDQLDQNKATNIAKRYYISKLSIMEPRQKRIVFFAPGIPYPFTDDDYEGKGVGGAEASLIQLARALSKCGYRVEIYNRTNTSGLFNGVYYFNTSQFMAHEYTDVFVLFRSYHTVLDKVFASLKLFWSCDQTTDYPQTWMSLVFPNVDHVIAISDYHKNYLSDQYKLSKDKITVIDLGVNWDDYKYPLDKIRGKAIYCSVPGRGLDRLSRVADEIKLRVPEFQLVITSDYRLWGLDTPDNEQYREMFKNKDYVTFLGKIKRQDLIREQMQSEVMAYPCNYEECFCISAIECMAAGAVPVTIDKGAMKQTVGDGGLVLSSVVSDKEYVESVVKVLTTGVTRVKLKQNGRAKAETHDWSIIASKWLDLFTLLRKDSMLICTHCNAKVPTSYILQQHISKRHPETIIEVKEEVVLEPEEINYVVIKFREKVEIGVNGNMFIGKEVKIPYQFVDTVLQIAKESYGSDIVI